MSDEQLLLRCSCGGYHYLDIMMFDQEDDWPAEFYFVLTDEPNTLREKLSWLFQRGMAAREIQLTLEQATQLRDVLLKQIPLKSEDRKEPSCS